ncbi:hypothetical protein AURDEDRAFT_162128 [Auricularia subglabra TFB-10046 SS5]|nr:hypothetical protein AURDEDRAFT_162128 [Auricularia subglabra TFB-10046 SS5]
MTNYKDPAVVFTSARALVLFVHTIFGTYLWEYLTSLWFDWEYVTRARKLGFASSMYFLARYATLASLIVALRVVNAVEPIDCTAWNYLLYAFAFSGVAFGSMLLFLRVVAVSCRNKTVIAIFAIFYGGNWLAVIYGIYNSNATYVPVLSLCYATDLAKHKPSTFVQFAFDFACLIAMSLYLTRGPREEASVRNFLFNQGIVYFICVTVAYGLATVFLFLDLNDPISQMPNLFALAMMTICSTRMHRLLATEQIGTKKTASPPARPMSVVALGASLPTARSPKVHSVSMPVPRIQVHRATTATTDDGKKLSDEDLYTLAKLDGSRPGTARRDSEPFADV